MWINFKNGKKIKSRMNFDSIIIFLIIGKYGIYSYLELKKVRRNNKH